FFQEIPFRQRLVPADRYLSLIVHLKPPVFPDPVHSVFIVIPPIGGQFIAVFLLPLAEDRLYTRAKGSRTVVVAENVIRKVRVMIEMPVMPEMPVIKIVGRQSHDHDGLPRSVV